MREIENGDGRESVGKNLMDREINNKDRFIY